MVWRVNIRFLNAYILAEDFKKLSGWYEKTFELDRGLTVEEDYLSMELRKNGKFVIAFADSKEMGITPYYDRQNTVIAQLAVSNVKECLERVSQCGGKALFGPSFDETGKFYYGGFSDIEGNQIWVVQE